MIKNCYIGYGKKVHGFEQTFPIFDNCPFPIDTVCGDGGYMKLTKEEITCKKCLRFIERGGGKI